MPRRHLPDLSRGLAIPRVHRLLLSLFTACELRLLLMELADSEALIAALPVGGVSLSEYVLAAVEALDRNGAIDGALFELLLAARPRRKAHIIDCATALGLADPDRPRRSGQRRADLR